MMVFKGFLILVKQNIAMLFLYLAVFMTITVSVQIMTKGEGMTNFQEESLDIAVIDRDGGELAEGLKEYLGEKHHLVNIPDRKESIQENLFYRNVYYVVTIQKGFEKAYLQQGKRLKTTKVPGTFSAYFIDQQIDTFLNHVRVLKAAGFSTEEAVKEAGRIGNLGAEVTMIDKTGHGGAMPPYAYMFQFMPYLFLGVLCYIIGFVMIAYREKDVRRRMLCSCVSLRRQNMGLIAGYLVVGVIFWAVCMLLPVIMYGKEFLGDPNLPYYLLNTFAMILVALSLSFIVGVTVRKPDIVNAVVNVLSLGMCFTCGVFVSISVLSKGVRTAAHFLPVYWYVTVNEIIGNHAEFTSAQNAAMWRGIGIQVLFAAVFLSIGLAIGKYKEQEQS